MDNFTKTLSLIVISMMIQFCITGMLISKQNAFPVWLLVKGVKLAGWQEHVLALETA